MAKASRKSTPASVPAGKIIDVGSIHFAGESTLNVSAEKPGDTGKITMAGKSGLAVDARHIRPMDISDWKKRGRTSLEKRFPLLLPEAERRLRDEPMPPDMLHKTFASDLLVWLGATYPRKKLPKVRAIEDCTRALWHRYRG